MKKYLSLFVIVLLFACLVGCQAETPADTSEPTKTEAATIEPGEENATEEIKEVLQKVLNQEQNFIFKSLVYDNVSEENLNNFFFSTEANVKNAFIPQEYAYVDFNSDNVDEMVILSAKLDYFLTLHYDAETVYGYVIPQRSLIDLKTDGSFMTSSGAGINTISTLTFADASFEIEDKAYQDVLNNKYQLDGKDSNKETVEDYFKNWEKSTSDVSWESLEYTNDEEEPVATKPKPQIEMDQEELAKVVAKNLGVPDGLKFTYEIGDLFYWDAGEIWLRHVAIHAEDGGGATAAVDPTTGELIRSILNYEKPE